MSVTLVLIATDLQQQFEQTVSGSWLAVLLTTDRNLVLGLKGSFRGDNYNNFILATQVCEKPQKTILRIAETREKVLGEQGRKIEPLSKHSLKQAIISVSLLKHCRYNCVSLPLPLGNVGKKFQPN